VFAESSSAQLISFRWEERTAEIEFFISRSATRRRNPDCSAGRGVVSINQITVFLFAGNRFMQTSIIILALTGSVLLQVAEKEKNPAQRWENTIGGFEKQDKEKPPLKDAILFVGSSSIALWNVAKSFPDLKVINRGFGGSQISDSVYYAQRIVVKYQPRIVVFYAGDNDIAFGKSPERLRDDFKHFAEIIRKDLPDTTLLFLAVKPSLLRWKLFDKGTEANKLIEAYCRSAKNIVYVDVVKPMLGEDGKPKPELFLPDGLHMNEAGYKVWTSILKPYLIGDREK
jgi:lysophospholipase L1-like esterase